LKGKLLPTEFTSKPLSVGGLKNKQTVCVYGKFRSDSDDEKVLSSEEESDEDL